MESPRTDFGRKLRAEMTRQDVGVRELARRITNENPRLKFEDARRTIARWLTPGAGAVVPSDASREAVARALNVPLESLADEEQDEEEDTALQDLARGIKAFMRSEMAKASR